MNHEPPPRSTPLLTGLALIAGGLLLRQWQPRSLRMPDAPDWTEIGDSRMRRAARRTRDGVSSILPGNMTGSVGRTLILMGAGLIVVRALDLIAEDDDAMF